MEVDEKILDKIQACLRLAKSAEPHEAASALRRAQEMMEKYNVSQETLTVGVIVEEPLRSIASASRAKSWEARLIVGVAEAFGCKVTLARGKKPDVVAAYKLPSRERYATYYFIGPRADAKVAAYAAQVLQRQLQNARGRFTRGLPEFYSRGLKTAEVDAYCMGWVAEALRKCEKLKVAPVREKAIDDYLGPKTINAPSPKVNHRDGGSHLSTARGMEDGQSAELHRPMERGADKRQLGDGS